MAGNGRDDARGAPARLLSVGGGTRRNKRGQRIVEDTRATLLSHPQMKQDAPGRPDATLPPIDEIAEAERLAAKDAAREAARKAGTPGKRAAKFVFQTALLFVVWGAIGLALMLAWFARDLPDLKAVSGLARNPSVVILARDGEEISRFGDLQSEAIPVGQLPKTLIQAVLATEDRRFYSHFGLDPRGLARAMLVNLREGHVEEGGSTITQQLAKNLFLTPERTLRRKVQEAMIAVWLETKYTKDEILSMYLNRVYLGAGTYGVEAAAQTYFGKSARDLNLRESAMLAGLLKAPSKLSPKTNPDYAKDRADQVIANMIDAGYLTRADVDDFDKAQRFHPPRSKPVQAGEAQYFASWVADQVEDYIGADHGDIVIHTTLDSHLQRTVETETARLLDGDGAKSDIGQAAVVVMQPDGAVRALLGGRDWDDSKFNRATQARRQPGSAFKPIVLLSALQQGFRPETPVEDRPLAIDGWTPSNYNDEYQGSTTLLNALIHSSNVVFVKLLQSVGPRAAVTMAHRLGIESELRPELGLALGASEVTPLELTGAYAAFANGGQAVQPYAIDWIERKDGKVLYKRNASNLGRVADPAIIGTLNGMLEQVVLRGTGVGAQLDRPVGGKTGTTSDYRDAWFMGFTHDLVGGVWMGNDDSAPMKRVTGGSMPAKLWAAIMRAAHRGVPVADLAGSELRQPPVALGAYDPSAGDAWSPTTGTVGQAAPRTAEAERAPAQGGFFERIFGSDNVEYTYPGDRDGRR